MLDGAFFLLGAALVAWLAWIVATRELTFSPTAVGALVVLWLLLAYVGLPRLQEALARVYVPDYFIGRAVTDIGVLGDPVNLAVDGDEPAIHAAMTRAGWTRADEVTLRSSWGIVVSAVLRRSYPGAPVSPLLLFGRRQAFAYEQEVDGNAAQRHHVRFWPVPDGWVLPGGYRVDWLAAATYDRAVGLSAFTLQVTHKVDADVDVERDFVVASVRYADPDVGLRAIDDFSTAFSARNGGGDLVRTDGQLPVLDLTAIAAGAPAPSPAAPLAARRLPPPMLLLAGLLSASKAGLALGGLLVVALGGSTGRWLPDVSGPQQVLLGAGAALILALWVLVLRRGRAARTLLMAVCAGEAIAQLAALSDDGRVSLLVLVTSGIAVLVLIAVSSTAARRWTAEGADASRS